MQLNLVKKIEILSSVLSITYNKTHDGGRFAWGKSEIEIGIKSMDKDPAYTFSVISHELMEGILSEMGVRYQNHREPEKYLFSFSHQDFETAIKIHSQALSKFIK